MSDIERQKINHRSDFDAYVCMMAVSGTDTAGNPEYTDIGFPEWDFELLFTTRSSPGAYRASSIGGRYTNLVNDGGRVHVVFDRHGLRPGRLEVTLKADIPNDLYPDGHQLHVIPSMTEIELTREAAPCPSSVEIEAVLPAIKGEPFTYEDFTGEQIEELQRPATEAAGQALEMVDALVGESAAKVDNHIAEVTKMIDTLVSDSQSKVGGAAGTAAEAATKATSAATDAASAATKAEGAAAKADKAASGAEQAERLIESAEQGRATAEADRAKAETVRAAEFATYRPLIDSKQPRLADSGDITVGEDDTLSLTDRAKRAVFDDIAKRMGITIDQAHTNENGAKTPYFLNGLWLTYGDVTGIMCYPRLTNANLTAVYAGAPVRTHLPHDIHVSACNGEYLFTNSAVEAVNIGLLLGGNETFKGCGKLKRISMYAPNKTQPARDTFSGCSALESINGLVTVYPHSFSLADSPLLDLGTFQDIVRRYNNKTVITVTVHPEVYAKLTDTANAEWHRVLTDGAAKNISFATITE